MLFFVLKMIMLLGLVPWGFIFGLDSTAGTFFELTQWFSTALVNIFVWTVNALWWLVWHMSQVISIVILWVVRMLFAVLTWFLGLVAPPQMSHSARSRSDANSGTSAATSAALSSNLQME